MKSFFKTSSVKMLLSVLFVTIVLSVFTNSINNNFLSSTVNSVTYGLSKVTAAASNDDTASMSEDELKNAYKALKEENADLRSRLADYYDTKYENARLWKFYDLKKENPQYSIVPSTVLKRDSNDEFYSFTLDKGTTSDVSVNDPVVSQNGLIGRVCEVDANTCRVATLLSPQLSVGVIDNKSKDTGIVCGDTKLCDENLTAMKKLNAHNKISKGDIITTTGIGGVYPKGLVIGKVTDVCYDTYDSSYYAKIKPFDDIKTVTELAVITDFTGQGEVLKSVGSGNE